MEASKQPPSTGNNYTHLSPTGHIPKGPAVYIIRFRFRRHCTYIGDLEKKYPESVLNVEQ